MKENDKISNARKFLELFKEIESHARNVYRKGREYPPDESFVKDLKRDRRFIEYSKKIDCCKYVRNFLVHNLEFNSEFPVEPSNEMIIFLQEKILEVFEKPKTIRDIWIPKEKVFFSELGDKVLPIMKSMRNNNYTHIPILENGVVTGVFSENTLFDFIIDEGIMDIDDKTLMSDFKNILPVEKHINESFHFVSKDITLYEIGQMFENDFTSNKRIGMIFATQSGKSTEKVLGVITPWDVLGQKL